MNCPSCGATNREGAKFCRECGNALATTIDCPNCGASNPSEQKFCDACGFALSAPAQTTPQPRTYVPQHLAEKILRERADIEGERRTVTVLFADAAGFTPISEKLTEEQVYALMQGCVQRMMDAVHRYEGTITQFRGDGVMALFGAPIAHEDAARRAVASALEMQAALQTLGDEIKMEHPSIDCQFRVGLNTGPVVVGSISDNLEMDYTALGDTVNLASRLEAAAERGSVYISEATYRQVADHFECEDLAHLRLKGKTEPAHAYKALREKPAKTRLELASERGLTPFVGRFHELAVLEGYLKEAKNSRGRVVFISGEAGIGKSRLLHEFRGSLGDSAFTWLEGHCISYGQTIPYLPIVDFVKKAFGVEETDDDAAIISRIDRATSAWDNAARATVPYIKHLLAVDPGDPALLALDPRERRAGTLDALRTLVLRKSVDRPLVMVVEDLHWIDEKSEEAIAALVDIIPQAPVLMLLTYRPGYAHSLGDRSYYTRVALDHLTSQASAEVARGVLGVATLPQQLHTLITDKAEGNPFFIEEVTKSLQETGVLVRSNGSFSLQRPVEEISIPDTIQDVILSRIDRLERQAKEALQLASVIGREFTVRLLQRISDIEARLDDALNQLKLLELIYEKSYFPELAYMFKHALTHDVAYSTLLTQRRKSLHSVVAAAIEELYGERLPEHYETLAYHYHEAQLWPKALDYLIKSADKVYAADSAQEAVRFSTMAIEVATKIGDEALPTAASIVQKRGIIRLWSGDVPGALTDLERLIEIGKQLRDSRLEGIGYAFRGFVLWVAHEFEESEEALRTAIAIGERGFDDVLLLAFVSKTALCLTTNRHREAEELAPRLRELVEKSEDPFGVAFWAVLGVEAAHWKGRSQEAIEHFEKWRGAVESSGDASVAVGALWAEGLALGASGRYQKALDSLHTALARADRLGDIFFKARILNSIGWVYAELQDNDRSIEWNSKSLEVAAQIEAPDPEIEFNARINLGDAFMAQGNLAEADKQYRIVERVVRKPAPPEIFMLWRYSQHLFHSYGELHLSRGDAKGALAYADEALEGARQSESRKNLVKGHRLKGQAFMSQSKLDDADREISQALEIAEEIGSPAQLWKTHVARAELRNAQRRRKEAQKSYADALAVIENVAAELANEETKRVFLESATITAVRKAAGL